MMTVTIAKAENPNGTTENRSHRWLDIDVSECVYCRLRRALAEDEGFEYFVLGDDGFDWTRKAPKCILRVKEKSEGLLTTREAMELLGVRKDRFARVTFRYGVRPAAVLPSRAYLWSETEIRELKAGTLPRVWPKSERQ